MCMIKISDDALALPLKIVFKNCIQNGIFQEIWRMANIVPVHKKNSKNLKQSYHLIYLLPIFGKVFEKIIYDTIYEHLNAKQLVNPYQSGFHANDSMVNQLLLIVHTICTAFDCSPPLDVQSIFLDISKAFDRAWCDDLVYRLRLCDVAGGLLLLTTNFLQNRQQHTVLNGKASEWGKVTAGIPQGSMLGPIFFLMYINNLTDNLKCNVKLFVDDTSLFTTVYDSNHATSDMNRDLDIINN